MGKIGNLDYPDFKIHDAMEITKVIEDRFNGRVENQATLAQVLGHKTEKSGGFISKITALRRYGLVTGRGEIETTQLAKSIVYPKNQEEQTKAVVQAIENVELFKRIFERLGEAMPSGDFWVDLVEITGAERGEAQKDAIKIRNLYVDGLEYMVSSRKAERKLKGIEEKPSKVDIAPMPSEALFELRTREYGTLIVKDEESIAVARKLIDIIEGKLKGKEKNARAPLVTRGEQK